MSAQAREYDTLADLSLEIVCLLIEYLPPTKEEVESLLKTNPAIKGIVRHLEVYWKEDVVPATLTENEFQRLLNRVEGHPNYRALYRGIVGILGNYVTSKNSALPNSIKELKCFNELAIFLLRLVTLNPVRKSIMMDSILRFLQC